MEFHDTTPTDPEDDDDDPSSLPYSARSHLDDDDDPPHGFATHTAFDAYFAHASKPSRTSPAVFSHLVPPLTPAAYAAALARLPPPRPLWTDPRPRAALFARWRTELRAGFHLLLHGYGSKRAVLTAFARALARAAPVLVANAHAPAFALPPLLAALPAPAPDADADTAALYVVLHGADAPALRTPKARAALAASPAPRASASSRPSTTSPPPPRSAARSASSSAPAARGCGTTSRRSRRARGGKAAAGPGPGPGPGAVAEGAARHVLASVTQKARRLFALLGARQLALMGADGAAGAGAAFGYAQLFGAARDEFIATNDTALRALLGEFRDHGLVVSTAAGGAGEALWIPMRRDALAKIVGELQVEQA
ncbi:origin recognition complex subunit 2-domain-containing protein [Amylocystis lapponica]|nr:origin recognition complex subunit 2-domain-containing protein [Amylocystis lapponica]